MIYIFLFMMLFLSSASLAQLQVLPQKPDRWESEFPPDLQITPGAVANKKIHFPWDPTGQNNYPASPECQPEKLRDGIWSDPSKVKSQARAINAWIEKCSAQISDPAQRQSYLALIRFARVNYRFLQNKNIHYVTATLPEGRFLTGFIAMKPGSAPRPLIIAKCGFLCNAEQGATQRSFLMHLYDESPFHVLALANITGRDFQIGNEAFSAGGFDEGRQLYQIARLIQNVDSPIRDRVSSVHVVGASLGGNGALYSGLYSSENDSHGHRAIQSVTAVCPVVVLKNAMHRLYFQRIISPVASYGTLHQVRNVFSFVPVLGTVFDLGQRFLTPPKVYDKVSRALLSYYQEWTEKYPWDLKPFEGTQIKTLSQFWELNDFRNYVGLVKVPTLMVQAENDGLVKSSENAEMLTDALRKTPNDQVDAVLFQQGNHCAFSAANGWANYSALLREYILSHAPEAKDHWHPRVHRLADKKWDIHKSDWVVETVWQARAGSSDLELKLKLFNPAGNGTKRAMNMCGLANPYRAIRDCYRETKMNLSISSLKLNDFEKPRNEYEATALTRFANTRIQVLNDRKQTLVGSNQEPKFIRFFGWD
jgi:pimeloyl-ACP methyl ester carboxylesterase